jgi:hypothetical protein
MRLKKAVLGLLVTAFAASSWGCGVIEMETTMGLVTDGETPSEISVNVVGFGGTTSLEGYLVMGMAIDLDVIALIFGDDILALLTVDDLLFAGTSMIFAGMDTGAICTIVNDELPGGGDIVMLDGVATGVLTLTSVPEPPVTEALTHCAAIVDAQS